MNNFASKTLFQYLRRISAVFKVCTNADTTLGNTFTAKLIWKLETAKKNQCFIETASEPPYCTISHNSIDPGIFITLYASAHHPYTTLATGEWMIFWPSEDSPIEVGSTECIRQLVFQSSLHVRLLARHKYYYKVHTCHWNTVVSSVLEVWQWPPWQQIY